MCTFEEGLCKEWIDADKSTDKNKKKYRIFADTLNYDGNLRQWDYLIVYGSDFSNFLSMNLCII